MTTQKPPSDCNAEKPIVEPNTQAFLDALAAKGGAPLEHLSVEEARQEAARGQDVDVVKLPADKAISGNRES